jgi:hypothetical protein
MPNALWLAAANIPWRRAVVVGRIPGPSSHPFTTGWASVTGRDRQPGFLIAPPSSSRPATGLANSSERADP